MKKIFSLLLTVVLVFAVAVLFVGCSNNSGSDESDTETGVVYKINKDDDGNEYAVVDKYVLSTEDAKKVSEKNYADAMVDLEINVYEKDGKTYPVKEIAASAFADKLTIKSITFGPNVETFGSACLAGCANLESLTVPFVGKTADAVNDGKVLGYLFGVTAFDGGVNVTMAYNATGTKAYYMPTSLKTVTVTGNALSDYAFYATNLETVNLTGTVENIGKYAFYGMTKLVTYTLPASVKTVGDYAFASCSNLVSVDMSAATGLTSVGAHAFDGCSLLGYNAAYTFTLPATVTELGEKAFYNCTELKKVDFSASGVTKLKEYTFYGCEKLNSVKLKAGTTLSLGTFAKCKALEKANVENLDAATADLAFDVKEDDQNNKT